MGRWMDDVERALRERPPSGPEPTDQETYWDSGQTADGMEAEDVPWLDQARAREKELGHG